MRGRRGAVSKQRRGRGWMAEHVADPFVRRAQQAGYRSRAAFKLLELDEKHRLLRRGATVVDLGAAPGGWSQVAAERVGGEGTVIALDRLEMDPIAGVTVLQADFEEEAGLRALLAALPEAGADVVLSDMAPNLSGVRAADQARASALVELALELAVRVLRPGGALAVKLFQGAGFDEFLAEARRAFEKVTVRKPDASRSRSREVYAVCEGRRAE
ncbi:MAG: SAM-dependent methyltransferase [Pseudomonadales bacterium]|jgi:23S rRNA (uridine2552-2'-O)-methyltransferase|nr:SAM-dependent methyltransferase [Pseudomonadales bacterium]